jgi:hypothetical protein
MQGQEGQEEQNPIGKEENLEKCHLKRVRAAAGLEELRQCY